MQVIFAFTFNSETKDATFTGNVQPALALQILQDIVIAEAVRNAEAAQKKAKDKAKGKE